MEKALLCCSPYFLQLFVSCFPSNSKCFLPNLYHNCNTADTQRDRWYVIIVNWFGVVVLLVCVMHKSKTHIAAYFGQELPTCGGHVKRPQVLQTTTNHFLSEIDCVTVIDCNWKKNVLLSLQTVQKTKYSINCVWHVLSNIAKYVINKLPKVV